MGRHHARVYSQFKDAELVAVADLNQSVGQKLANVYNCEYFEDYREMLKKIQIDAVSVVVPTRAHLEVALDVIAGGKHLLVEKPLASTVQEGKEIVKRARKAGVKLAVGHIERFNPVVIKLKKMITEGQFGKIVIISAKRVGPFPSQIQDVDVFLDLAIHDVDIFSYLLEEEPWKIFSSGGMALGKKRNDHGEILLRYPSGTIGTLQVDWLTPIKIRTVSITGSQGYAEFDSIAKKLKFYHRDSGGIEVKVVLYEPLKEELRSFVDAIKKNERPVVDGEIGLMALKNIYRIIKAINEG